jgi:hypothetical protein
VTCINYGGGMAITGGRVGDKRDYRRTYLPG